MWIELSLWIKLRNRAIESKSSWRLELVNWADYNQACESNLWIELVNRADFNRNCKSKLHSRATVSYFSEGIGVHCSEGLQWCWLWQKIACNFFHKHNRCGLTYNEVNAWLVILSMMSCIVYCCVMSRVRENRISDTPIPYIECMLCWELHIWNARQ